MLAALAIGGAVTGCNGDSTSSGTATDIGDVSSAAVDPLVVIPTTSSSPAPTTTAAPVATTPAPRTTYAPTTTRAYTPPPAPARTTPAPKPAPAPAPAPAPSGYKAGQFCKQSAEGTTATASNGTTIKCVDVNNDGHPHWEPA